MLIMLDTEHVEGGDELKMATGLHGNTGEKINEISGVEMLFYLYTEIKTWR